MYNPHFPLLLLLSSSEESSAVCFSSLSPLFMSNASVAGRSPRKVSCADWKTIQFSLARPGACCGLGLCFVKRLCGGEGLATRAAVMVSQIHPTQADEASVRQPNCHFPTAVHDIFLERWNLMCPSSIYYNSGLLLSSL